MKIDRLEPKVVYQKDSPNQSTREAPISLIVLHDTESHNYPGSPSDLEAIANYFAESSSQVSAHVITDGDGHSARCVPDHAKAWHCVSYNSAALGIEQIGFTTDHWSEAEWIESARWIALWSHLYHIPIRRAITARGVVLRSGVTTHKKLGIDGGGHVDPGPNYPFRKVLKQARRIKKLRYDPRHAPPA